jgi:hypothetical protein
VGRSHNDPIPRRDGCALRRGFYPSTGRLCAPPGFLSLDGMPVRCAGVPIPRRDGCALRRLPIPRRDGCALPRGSNDTAGAVARSPGVQVLRQDGGALRRGPNYTTAAVVLSPVVPIPRRVLRQWYPPPGFLPCNGTVVCCAGVPITRRGGGALPRYFNSATVALTRSADYTELLQRSGTLSRLH